MMAELAVRAEKRSFLLVPMAPMVQMEQVLQPQPEPMVAMVEPEVIVLMVLPAMAATAALVVVVAPTTIP